MMNAAILNSFAAPMKKFHVAVGYLPDAKLGPGVAGVLKTIGF